MVRYLIAAVLTIMTVVSANAVVLYGGKQGAFGSKAQSGGGGGGAAPVNCLLVDTGNCLLVDTGNKLLVN